MCTAIDIVIVDDHEMFREGIRKAVDADPRFKVVGEAANAAAAVELLEKTPPAIVILDIRMPGASGIELARTIRKCWPEIKILVLSGYDFDQYVRALARIGIHGYLLKDAPQARLIEALHEIAAGGVVLPPQIASKVLRGIHDGPSRFDSPLTMREMEVLERICEGQKNVEIAGHLRISIRTVETHISSISAKLGAHSRTEIVRIAVERGWIP